MENKEEFREGIESYRKRLIDELRVMNTNIDGFVDKRNDPFQLRHLISMYRRSLEKCNDYISHIEDIAEKLVEERGKDIKENPSRVYNQEGDGESSR